MRVNDSPTNATNTKMVNLTRIFNQARPPSLELRRMPPVEVELPGAGWIRLIDNRNPGTTCDEEKPDQWLWKKTIAALMLLPTTAQVIAKMNTVSIARKKGMWSITHWLNQERSVRSMERRYFSARLARMKI